MLACGYARRRKRPLRLWYQDTTYSEYIVAQMPHADVFCAPPDTRPYLAALGVITHEVRTATSKRWRRR